MGDRTKLEFPFVQKSLLSSHISPEVIATMPIQKTHQDSSCENTENYFSSSLSQARFRLLSLLLVASLLSPFFLAGSANFGRADEGGSGDLAETVFSIPVSSYLGGGLDESAAAVVRDAQGNIYIAGSSESPEFPTTPGAYDEDHNLSDDVFVLKLNPEGSQLLYSTFVGGDGNDYGLALAVDEEGCAYVTGRTGSEDFPTTQGCFDPDFNREDGVGYDAYVFKLSANGSELLYSSFLGGEGDEAGTGIALDEEENAYLTGHTSSHDFPTTPGCFDDSYGENGVEDIFVLKMNSEGSDILYSTFLGSSGVDEGKDIVVDGSGKAFVLGTTGSPDFPTTGAGFDVSHNGEMDLCLFGMNNNGSDLVFSSFIGGRDDDSGFALELDSGGNIWAVGKTGSGNFPLAGKALDRRLDGREDGFFLQFSPDGRELLYSSYLGGSWDETVTDLALDSRGNIYLCGYTLSDDFPQGDGLGNSSNTGLRDAFVCSLVPGIPSLCFSTLLGGTDMEYAWGIVVGEPGDVLVVGFSESADFPTTPGSQDEEFNGGLMDAFFTRMNFNFLPRATIHSVEPDPARPGETVHFNGSGSDPDGTVVAHQWYSSRDGLLGNASSFNTSSLSRGKHRISYRVQDDSGAWSRNATTTLMVRDPLFDLSFPLGIGTLALIFGMLSLSLGLLYFNELTCYQLQKLFLPLYTRLKKEDLMKHELRGRIYQIIVSNPGIHLRGILREYQKDNDPQLLIAGLVYHLEVLGKSRLIRSVSDGYRKRFYSRGHAVEKTLPQLILEKIEEYHSTHGRGITKRELAELFNVSEKVIATCLKKISDKVEKKREGRFLHYSPKLKDLL